MLYPKCPSCGSSQELDEKTYWGLGAEMSSTSLRCNNVDCKALIELKLKIDAIIVRNRRNRFHTLAADPSLAIDPELVAGMSNVLDKIVREHEESIELLSMRKYRATIIASRYVIQSALLFKGLDDDRPETMVYRARSQNLISEKTYRNCKAVVFSGGKAGHPRSDLRDEITENDASQSLHMTRSILNELFRLPSKRSVVN